MRIITGKHKGKRLKQLKGTETRPTSDKVKESIFQIIGPYFDGGICLDLFAGSGSLGLEAISRGMEKVIFIEKNPKAVKIVHENVEGLKLNDKQVEVYRNDASRALNVLQKRELKFDLIFVDPPYGKLNDKDIIIAIIENDLLNDNGLIYYEYDPSTKHSIDDDRLTIVKEINYGTTIGITIFKKVKQ